MVKIIVTDNKNRIIFRFMSSVFPRVGEQIQSPRYGTYTIEKVLYEVTDGPDKVDDGYYTCNDKLTCVNIRARQWKYGD